MRTDRKWNLDVFARKEYQAAFRALRAIVFSSLIGLVIWSLAAGLLLKSCFF